MIVDYFANFCDSEYCFDETHHCTYPRIKEAIAENMFNTQLIGKIEKIKVEVDARDKFHVYYPENAKWKCTIYIANKQLETFESPCDHNTKTIEYTYENVDQELKEILNAGNALIRCELYIDEDIVCPYGLSLIVYTKE